MPAAGDIATHEVKVHLTVSPFFIEFNTLLAMPGNTLPDLSWLETGKPLLSWYRVPVMFIA